MEMANVHIIYDFMHVYYKYMFMLRGGRLRELTAKMPDGSIVPVSNIYYPLNDIENMRKSIEARFGGQAHVQMSFCFDSPPTERQKVDVGHVYKAKRVHRLSEDDLANIAIIKQLLGIAGYGIHQMEGYEADDLVRTIVLMTENNFDATFVMTNDSDLAINVSQKTHVMRYRVKRKYVELARGNYEAELSDEFGCRIPYNTILMFKSLCGDKSDNVPGINGFGPKKFDKLISWIESNYNTSFHIFGSPQEVHRLINEGNTGLWDEAGKQQALQSLTLVAPKPAPITPAIGFSTQSSRKAAYLDTYGFASLV